MHHTPITLQNLTLSRGPKLCFEDFSTTLYAGDKIGIIGDNGSGKTSLLHLLLQRHEDYTGHLRIPQDVHIGYTPQIIAQGSPCSGAQRFQQAFSHALQAHPNLLILDEPTNHLDLDARRSLLAMLRRFAGTLLVVTHDEELLAHCVDIIWSIERKQVHIFTGSYASFLQHRDARLTAHQESYQAIVKAQKKIHHDRMKQQERSASRRKKKKNLQERDKSLRHAMKERAEKTHANHATDLGQQLRQTKADRAQFEHWNPCNPTFSLSTLHGKTGIVAAVSEGRVAYRSNDWLLSSITFTLHNQEKVWLQGKNGSGKTTLIKALLHNPDVVREGTWDTPPPAHIGYVDQHYATLDPQSSVFDHLRQAIPMDRSDDEARTLLGHFLFRTSTEYHLQVQYLSGGEKLRLSLAMIAARPTKLLILDEVTNNMNLKTKKHLWQVLQHYEGAVLMISHDEAFTKAVGVTKILKIHNQRLYS